MRAYLVALALVLTPTAAVAQINSTPPPLMGQASYHLYSVAGVVRTGAIETYFACTNTAKASIRVGVEIFGSNGGATNDPSTDSLDIPPGASRIFGTLASNSFVIHGFVSGASGSARILGTEKKGIICNAFLADPTNVPPTSMADLKVIAKTKQRGD